MRYVLALVALTLASPAQANLRAMDCGDAFNQMMVTFPVLAAGASVNWENVDEHFRFSTAVAVYRAFADMVSGQTPEETGANAEALGQIALALGLSARVMACDDAPVIMGNANAEFHNTFHAFNSDYPFDYRNELELMYGEYE